MGNQIVIHSPNSDDSRRRKATTDISLKSIVAREQKGLSDLRMDYSAVSEDIRKVVDSSDQLIDREYDRILTSIDLVYRLIANMYLHSPNRANFAVFEKAAKDYMRQFPQYFEV